MYLIIGIVLFWFLFLVAVARLERRMVWPYGELQPTPQFDDPTGYGARWVEEAVQNGFSFLGWASDLKGERYKVSYAMLISPKKDSLAVIGVGQVWKLPVNGTWLHTLSSDNCRDWYTTDNQACVEFDISGHKRSQLSRSKSFTALWQKHQTWVQQTGAIPHGFKEFDNLQVFHQFRESHYREMAALKLVCYSNAKESHWQYTLYGSVKFTVLNLLTGLLRALSFGRFPKSA